MNTTNFIEACFTQNALIAENSPLTESDVISSLLSVFRSKYKCNIVSWDPTNPAYPTYMFLGGDRGILAYVQFNYVFSNDCFTPDLLRMNSISVMQTIAKADSHLDRPVFFIHLINTADKTALLFETNEQIKDRWHQTNFSSDTYIPVVEEMGTVDNLLEIWTDLKKNSVRFY